MFFAKSAQTIEKKGDELARSATERAKSAQAIGKKGFRVVRKSESPQKAWNCLKERKLDRTLC